MANRLKIDNNLFFSYVEELIDKNESVKIPIKGTSMLPTLKEGATTVVLSPLSSHKLYIGAIALFRYRGQHVLHRLVEINSDYLLFQGDNVHLYQERVKDSDVVAIVERIIEIDNEKIIECLTPSYVKAAKVKVKRLSYYHLYKRIKQRTRISKLAKLVKR